MVLTTFYDVGGNLIQDELYGYYLHIIQIFVDTSVDVCGEDKHGLL